MLAAGFGAEQIAAAVQEHHYGMDVELSVEPQPLGTGGAIKFARDHAKGKKWMIMNGDCFSNVDFVKMLAFHDQHSAMVTLAVAQRDDAKDYGTIEMEEDNRIVAFREKEQDRTTGYVSVGVYCFEHEAFEQMPAEDKFSIETDFFPCYFGFIGVRFY